MSLHRGGPPGAVAVSYTTNTMAPLSPSRRYSSSSSSSASTPGITANGSKFSSYRSPSTALERSTYGSTSSTTTGSSASSYRLSARKTHCSPARSVSSYSDSGTVATVNLPPKYTSGSSTTSSLSSSASTNSRDRNGFVNPNLTEFYAKYSPNNYTPNIHGNGLANSSSSSTINGHCRSSFSLSSSSSIGGIAELHGGDDSGFRERRDRSYSSDTTSSINFGSERWSTRQTKRRNYPLNTVFAGHDQIDGVAAPNEVIIHHHPDQICKNSNPIDDSDDNGNSNSADNDKLVNNDQDSDNINNINHQNHLTLTNNQSRHLITPISTPSDPDHSSPESPASQPCNPISTASLTSIYTSSAGATDHRACEFNKTPTNPANTELPINDSDQEFSGHLEKNRQRELDRLALLNIPHGHVNNQEICGGSATTFSNSTADVDGAQSISESIKTPLTSLTNLNGLALHDECKISNMGSDLLEENKLSNRPTGFDEPSKPSTSSRRFECFQWDHSVEDFDASSANNTSSVPVAVHQAIYTGLNDQIEESSTSRPSRNRNQARRDDSHGLNGLRNIGNTCFMNSVIQCLSNTRPLLEYLLNEQYLNDINTTTSSMKGALIKAFAQVIHELWESSGDHAVNTASLKTQIQRFAPRFIGYAQQDAQEFLRYLLEGLHEDVNRVIVKPQPISTDIPDNYSDMNKAAESWKRYLRSEDSTIVDVFVGQLRSSLTCTSCDHVSVTLDPFWDLSLPIPSRSGTVRLNQCLEHFTKVETMDGDEKPTCSKCQMRRKCTKSFSIQKFPKILVIHLKRFSPTERFRAKLSVLVDFPLTGLDLSAFAAPGVQGCTYNLYGVANHSGTPYSGHYTAYCKHPYSGEWHEYNDSRVSAVSASSVISSEAYVLFYEQQPLSHHL